MTVWLAYYTDWSDFAIFATEIEALHYALTRMMAVKAVTLPATEIRATETRRTETPWLRIWWV